MKLSDVKRLMPVYYRRANGDTVPATVYRIGMSKVWIYGNFTDGNYHRWVKPENLEPQTQD